MKQVSLLTNTPPSKTADISTIGENTPSVNLVSSSSAPADSTPITSGDNPCNQRTNESTDQLSVSHDSVDTAELESSYDKDLSEVGGEGVCEGEGRREGGEAKGGGDEEEKTKDKRKPPPSPATKKRLVALEISNPQSVQLFRFFLNTLRNSIIEGFQYRYSKYNYNKNTSIIGGF